MDSEKSNKGVIVVIIVVLIILTSFIALNQSDEGVLMTSDDQVIDEIEELDLEAGVYQVDPSASSVQWQASKRVGGGHDGTVQVKSGTMVLTANQLVGGQVIIDMTTLANTDLEGDMSEKLDNHLKSDDFFSVDNYPLAQLDVVSVENGSTILVTADLRIRDQVKRVSLPVQLEAKNDTIIATADLKLNRDDFDIATADTLAEIGLKDNFEISIELVAKK